MKIKITAKGSTRRVLGRIFPTDTVLENVDSDIGKQLIRQGVATQVPKEEPKKRSID